MNYFLIQLCKDKETSYSLIDSYVTDSTNLVNDIKKLIDFNAFTYGIPVYIKIVSIQGNENLLREEIDGMC